MEEFWDAAIMFGACAAVVILAIMGYWNPAFLIAIFWAGNRAAKD